MTIKSVKNNSDKPIPQIKSVKRRQLLYQTVQSEIKDYIIQHSLKPGDPLPPETDLVQQLGISRNSVREAVKALDTLGILEARPGAGLFVRSFSFDPLLDNLAYGLLFDLKELTEILEMRSYIEFGLAERAIAAVSPEQLQQLSEILEQMRTAAENGVYSAERDRAFHQALWANVENSMARKMLDIFWLVFEEARNRASIPGPAAPVNNYRRHLAIVQALEERDVEAIRAAITHHYQVGAGYWPWYEAHSDGKSTK